MKDTVTDPLGDSGDFWIYMLQKTAKQWIWLSIWMNIKNDNRIDPDDKEQNLKVQTPN